MKKLFPTGQATALQSLWYLRPDSVGPNSVIATEEQNVSFLQAQMRSE